MTRPRSNSRSALGLGCDCRSSCSHHHHLPSGMSWAGGSTAQPWGGHGSQGPPAHLHISTSFACGCSCFPEDGEGGCPLDFPPVTAESFLPRVLGVSGNPLKKWKLCRRPQFKAEEPSCRAGDGLVMWWGGLRNSWQYLSRNGRTICWRFLSWVETGLRPLEPF